MYGLLPGITDTRYIVWMIQIVVEIMSVIMMVPGQPGNVLTSAPASAVRTIVMATLPVIMVHVQMGIAAIQKNIAVIAAMGIQPIPVTISVVDRFLARR